MIRLLVDAHVVEGFAQGTKSFVVELYKELATMRPDLDIYMACYDCASVKQKFNQYPNIKYWQLKNKFRLFRLGFELPLVVRSGSFDVLHTNYYLPFFKQKSCKYIVTVHDVLFLSYPQYFPTFYRLKNYFFFKLAILLASQVVTDSVASYKDIVKFLGCDEGKLSVIPLGLSPTADNLQSEALPSPLEEDRFLLYVSRLEPRKNHLELVKAFVELNLYEEFHLVLVGKKAIAYPEFDAYLASLPEQAKGKIKYFEQVSSLGLAKLYSSCRLFVYPSLCEGFGFPPLEAAQYGAPVITADNTSMSDFDFFRPGMYTAGDLEELKDLIQLYLSQNKMTYNRESELTNYTWNFTAKKYLDIFEG